MARAGLPFACGVESERALGAAHVRTRFFVRQKKKFDNRSVVPARARSPVWDASVAAGAGPGVVEVVVRLCLPNAVSAPFCAAPNPPDKCCLSEKGARAEIKSPNHVLSLEKLPINAPLAFNST